MEFLERLTNDINRNSIRPGVTFCAYVTHINHPHSFYVRPIEYSRYMSAVHARSDPINKYDVRVGAIVVFQCQETQDFVRGKIVRVEGEGDQIMCDIYALDVGCREQRVPLQKIWKPTNQANLPALAYHCQLANCQPRYERWDESSIEAMRGYVEGKVARIKIKNMLGETLLVEVCISSPDDLATLLAISRHATWDCSDEDNYPLLVYTKSPHLYSERILQVKSIIHVRMQSGTFLDKFFAAPVDEYNTFVEDRNNYTAIAANQRPLVLAQLKRNKPVGVFYYRTNKYERGIVREIYPKKYTAKVELVDWGKFIEEPFKSLRHIPPVYLKNPPIAIYCGIHISQYAKKSAFEMAKLANISRPGIEFDIRIEEISKAYERPNQVTVFGVKM